MSKLTFFLLCLEGAILSFNVAASAAIVPSVAKDFVLSQFMAGKIVWLYMLPYGLAALFYGPLVRIVNAKHVELFCILLFSLANFLAGTAKNIYILFAARVLMGLFGASVIPLALILIAKKFPDKERGKYVGIFFSATFIASLVGLFLSGILYWRLLYLIPSLLGFILCVFMYIYLPDFEHTPDKFRLRYLEVFAKPNVLRIFIYIFAISLFYHGIQQWLAVYFSRQFYLSQFIISMLVTLTSLSGVFGEIIGGWLSGSWGRMKIVQMGIALMILSVFIILLNIPVMLLAILMIIWGMGWTFNHVGVSTILTDLPHEALNEAASLNSSVRFISGGIGAAFGGILMQMNMHLNFIFFGVSLILLSLFTRKLLFAQR